MGELIRDIYSRILSVVDTFLKDAGSDVTIEVLSSLDPTLDQIVEITTLLVKVLNDLATADDYNDVNMSINAIQCCHILKQFKEAVDNGEEDRLSVLVAELEKHVNVPVPS